MTRPEKRPNLKSNPSLYGKTNESPIGHLAALSWLRNNPERREGYYTRFSARNAVRQVCKPVPGGISDSLRREASQAAGAAPTLRYGPAGDSAPRLRLKASSMAERFPFGPSTRPECPGLGCDDIERYQMRYKITG